MKPGHMTQISIYVAVQIGLGNVKKFKLRKKLMLYITKKALRKGIFLFRTQTYVKKTKKLFTILILRNFIYNTFFTKLYLRKFYGNK